MKPSQKISISQVITISWVFLIVGCGSSGSSNMETSTSSPPAAQPVTVSNTAQSPKDLKVGDVYQAVVKSGESTLLDLSGVDEGSEYVLAVSNLTTTGSSLGIQLATSESALVEQAADLNAAESVERDHNADVLSDVAARFHEELRFKEMSLSADPVPAAPASMGLGKAVATADVAMGDTKSFQVLSSLSGGGSITVTGVAYCVTTNVVMYVDQEVQRRNPDDLSRSDVLQLCSDFDSRVTKMRSLFGAESDVNGDGRFAVLMTPQINRMGAALGGLITGFFYAGDLYGLNNMEVLYTLVPDSRGVYGANIPQDFAMTNLLPPVFVHEFQHMVNYNQHVLLRGGQPEMPIFNEGASHFAEDVMGVGMENYARYATYMSRPESYGLLSAGSPNLGARGAAYLFLRYLYEQSGKSASFVSGLLASESNGIGNLEEAFAGSDASFDQFQEFFLRWNATMILGSEGLSQDSRFSYQPRVKNAETGEWEGVCLKCEADDGRGTIISGLRATEYSSGYTSGNIPSGGVQFYRVSDARQPIYLNGRGAGEVGAVLVRVK